MGESQSGQSQEVNERLKYSHSERERGREGGLRGAGEKCFRKSQEKGA